MTLMRLECTFKYFKRAETYRGNHASDQHGFSGPVTISRPRYSPGLCYWLDAGRSLGYDIADPNGPQRISFTAVDFTKKRGRRVNSFSGYIKPILSSFPNLRIVTNTTATRIIFEGNRAVGIHFKSTSPHVLQNIPDNTVYARKEIILSAGTYGSPLLLLRSGVGPKDSLLEANIPIVKELPVGLNFQDHVLVRLPFIINDANQVKDDARDLNPRSWELFEKFGDGPYSSTLGTSGQAFLASSIAQAKGQGNWADLHLTMAHNKGDYLGSNASVNSGEVPMSATVFMTRPESRGSLKLDPNDPDGPPILDLGFLTDESYIQKLFDGIQLQLRIFEGTPAYRQLGARFPNKLNLPGREGFPFRSKEYWICLIRFTATSGYHPTGTCRMVIEASPDAVVNTELRVIGIDGLRVVDASIMLAGPNTNTQAAVYAIAEKASDLILKNWEQY